MDKSKLKSRETKLCILDVGNRLNFFDGELIHKLFEEVRDPLVSRVNSDVYATRYLQFPHRHSCSLKEVDSYLDKYKGTDVKYPPPYVSKEKLPSMEQVFAYVRDKYDAIIIGGAEDSARDDSLPYLFPLIDLIKLCVHNNYPILGICFGAQSIARATHGKCFLSTMKEEKTQPEYGYIRYHIIHRDPEDPILEKVPDSFVLASYHRECFKVDREHRLIFSKGWSNEAFHFDKKRCYGFQFHPGFKKEETERELDSLKEKEPTAIIRRDAEEPDRQVARQLARNFVVNVVFKGSRSNALETH